MATRGERMKAAQQRSGPKRPSKPATPRKDGGKSTLAPNRSLGKKAVYALEDSDPSRRPPRKSTRISKHRQKAGTQQKARQELQINSPSERQSRNK
jgi:hypothetical protein